MRSGCFSPFRLYSRMRSDPVNSLSTRNCGLKKLSFVSCKVLTFLCLFRIQFFFALCVFVCCTCVCVCVCVCVWKRESRIRQTIHIVRACIEKEEEEAVGCAHVPHASCVCVRTCTREIVCANERERARVWGSTHARAKTPVANVCAKKKGQRVGQKAQKNRENKKKRKNNTKKTHQLCFGLALLALNL